MKFQSKTLDSLILAHLNMWDATPGRKQDLGSETPGAAPATPRMWDPTPAHLGGSETPAAGAATPGAATPGRRNRWDETPRTERETPGHGAGWAETPRTDRQAPDKIISETPTPSASKRRSRWDETPGATPAGGANATPTPAGGSATPSGAATPSMMTPSGEIYKRFFTLLSFNKKIKIQFHTLLII